MDKTNSIIFDSADVWVMIAIIYHHEKGGASVCDILSAVDSMNRMVLTFREVKEGIEKLYFAGYILLKGKKFDISEYFCEIYQSKMGRGSLPDEFKSLGKFFLRREKRQIKKKMPIAIASFSEDDYKKATKKYRAQIKEFARDALEKAKESKGGHPLR